MKKYVIATILCALLAIAVTVNAQKPARNVSGQKHANLAAAQRLSAQAYEKLEAAQKANEWDMGGHAAKAKDLLRQANDEIKLAAEAANENKGK
jgi:hypothetical protein